MAGFCFCGPGAPVQSFGNAEQVLCRCALAVLMLPGVLPPWRTFRNQSECEPQRGHALEVRAQDGGKHFIASPQRAYPLCWKLVCAPYCALFTVTVKSPHLADSSQNCQDQKGGNFLLHMKWFQRSLKMFPATVGFGCIHFALRNVMLPILKYLTIYAMFFFCVNFIEIRVMAYTMVYDTALI